jgi:hypothetical protein
MLPSIMNTIAETDPDTGWVQSTVGYGVRSSAATAYLAPQYINRPNLSVLLHARATKVVQTDKVKGIPLFGAVDFAHNPTCSSQYAFGSDTIIAYEQLQLLLSA